MNRVARIVFTGILIGIGVFIIGNLTELLTSYIIRAPETAPKMGPAISIFLTFLFDLVVGLLITVAYGILRSGLPANRILRALTFAVVLIFVNAVPRAADAYIGIPIPNTVVAVRLAGWVAEAFLAAFLVTLIYPGKKKPAGPKEKYPLGPEPAEP
jgi:hypothetical protein